MERIFINTPLTKSEILVGHSWENLSELLPETGVVIITDDNILKIYRKKFPDFPVLSVAPGEKSKQLSVIEKLAGGLLELGIDRTGFILAIGGGVVCDIAGFLASVYMRGIRCGFVSTSLLSQVDASTGGKNGVNQGSVKNIIGTIRQPEFVLCDPEMLLTLPDDEFLSGLSELIKTAIIGDKVLFEFIENSRDEILKKNTELLTMLITRAVNFKSIVVTEDERETGLRRILNFGHTYGHAIELERGIMHGFAVALGMELATAFSKKLGYLSADEADRIVRMLNAFNLLDNKFIPAEDMEKLIVHDKKKAGSSIHFVFAEGIGQAVVRKMTVSEITDFYREFRNKY